jgi:hypothetical protein
MFALYLAIAECHFENVSKLVVSGPTGSAGRSTKSRQSANGPIPVIVMGLMPSSPLRQLSGDFHRPRSDCNWVDFGMSAIGLHSLIADLAVI